MLLQALNFDDKDLITFTEGEEGLRFSDPIRESKTIDFLISILHELSQ